MRESSSKSRTRKATQNAKRVSISTKKAGRKSKYTIGIDLGGTKLAAALVDPQGKILSEAGRPTVPPELKDQDIRSGTEPTPAQVKKHVSYLIEAMADAVVEAMGENCGPSEISGVGLAAAGPMNIFKGTLDHPSNFKGWKVVPIVSLLGEALKKRGIRAPISFQNDAIAAALGEGWVGRARDCSTYAMVTVGTGIGSGVIFNGLPAQSAGMGSEWGHMLSHAPGIGTEPERYYERSVEGMASGTGIILRAKAKGFKGETASDVAAAARGGDKLAQQIFEEAAEALACLFYTLSMGFHPEKFVVSGGMLALKELFLPRAIELYQDLIKRSYPDFKTPVQVAQLGTKAGVIGAARLPHLASQH